MNSFNSLLLAPIILSIFGPRHKQASRSQKEERYIKSSHKMYHQHKDKTAYGLRKKKRSYPRVQSEISLSTISEEPQSEAHIHDLKFDLSIRCY